MLFIRKRLLLLLLLSGLLLITAVYHLAFERSRLSLMEQGEISAALYVESIRSEFDRRRHLPEVLSTDQDIVAVVSGASASDVNLRLERLAQATEVEAIYVMNRDGLTVAASNWQQPDTFLNQNYGFREYFRHAVRGNFHREFAIGATTGRPGLFVSYPVRQASGEIRGVVVVKVDLTTFSEFWQAQQHEVLLINSNGIVVDAGREEWRFRSTRQLSVENLEQINQQKQFADYDLALLDLEIREKQLIYLDGEKYFQVGLPIEWLSWQLWLLVPQQLVRQQALVVVAYVALVILLIISAISLFLSERFRSALRLSQQEGYELKQLNDELGHEIEERRLAEAELKNAQSKLKQSAKLAALGQLAASITHELGQPLSAMKTYVRGAQRELVRGAQVKSETIERLDRLVDRISNLTRQLKFFTRRGGEPLKPLELRTVIEGAVEIIGPRAEDAGVSLRLDLAPIAIIVSGGQQRLEQVLVNLISNAIDSLGDQTMPEICVHTDCVDGFARLIVRDNGRGIAPEIEDTLFEPFTTTRASGDGMGLGLAISFSIVEEHGGEIIARNLDQGGVEFLVSLPIVETGSKSIG